MANAMAADEPDSKDKAVSSIARIFKYLAEEVNGETALLQDKNGCKWSAAESLKLATGQLGTV